MRRMTSTWLALLLTCASFALFGAHAAAEENTAPLSDLEARLRTMIEGYPAGGEYAVAVTDLQTGEAISVNGDRPHLSACSINLMVLLQATLDAQAGRVAQSDVDGLIAQTVYSSNAVTARELYGVVGKGDVVEGVRRVASLMDEVGMEDSVLDHPPGYGGESLAVNPNNWLTALDANRALQWIWDGRLTKPWRNHLLDQLTGVKPGLNYLMAVAPGTVSHKNGFFPALDGTYVDNDVAIIRFEQGGQEYAYAVSFFSQWVPVKYDDIPLGQSIAQEVWGFFTTRYSVQ